MSDKHESKQKKMRAKAHLGLADHQPKKMTDDPLIEHEIKTAAGNVQEELAATRRVAGHAHTH